ncbi:MAG: tRNA pseudouridine(38-40) synthase TruA [Gammaproteobacteria bacterium RIFCSPHIGHO2_12_FULL_41_20]|nr:MAG: tRNA pseudouridine(38-40) synthase TruA [Gammaproteobacteria bacterium RIFCSPHIGHO2_12_FULL_41_20]
MRIALGVEYNGHGYYGWQAQQALPTIQGMLEMALSKVANEAITLTCAGRTDAGVHAIAQVVHFDTQAKRNLRAWIRGANTYLPNAIAVRWAQEVDEQFHARFSAMSRRYCYVIFNYPTRPALFNAQVSWYYSNLDVESMQSAANYLIGEHDFSSFRSAQCMSRTAMRHVVAVAVQRQDNIVTIDIEANAFLHHMVRNITGSLLQIGSQLKPPEWVLELLHARDRTLAAETASAHGLYLTQVRYPEPYIFPAASPLILV